MKIVKNIENVRSKRQPKPSMNVLENVKDQKKKRLKESKSLKKTHLIINESSL